MRKGTNILKQFTRRWQFMIYLEIVMLAVSLSILAYLLTNNILISTIAFIVFIGIGLLIKKPWKTKLNKTTAYLDSKLDHVEYSSGLLLQSDSELTGIAKLQQNKIAQKLEQHIKLVKPPNNILRTSILSILIIVVGLLAYILNFKSYFSKELITEPPVEVINFRAVDSVDATYKPPSITEQSVSINYPNYTQLATKHTSNLNIKAVEGSFVTWSLKFDKSVKSVHLESAGNTYDMLLTNDVYSGGTKLSNSGFYNFKFIDTLNQVYTSDLYAIEVIQDKDPDIKIVGLDQFTSFNFNETKLVNFRAELSDDFGLADAYIIATVSKGSGESVKFREEKLSFNTSITSGSKNANLSKSINLDNMNMEPGDELYFYVEALDQKQPQPNIARSETYFAAINDTITDQFRVEGTLGVNRMPDYFRSQRQLIIDTEKLIANKENLTEYEFKFTSNELGFDQKALRLKYSAFMGEETENVDLVDEENLEALEEDHDHGDEEEEDPLAEYTHDHDNENEHNLVDEDGEKEEDPLEEYMHNHEDPEAATLFEESLKTKLLKALQQMWDSELQLRLYKPEASLPHQYKALKYLQDIKNSARIYVHRIGFDPPPIKEESRLTGDIDEVTNFSKQKDLTQKDEYQFMRQSVTRLEQLINEDNKITENDRFLFEQAGNELAVIAIDQPGYYLMTLQQLKQLTTFGDHPTELLEEVQSGLLKALPDLKSSPNKSSKFSDELNQLLLKELQINDK